MVGMDFTKPPAADSAGDTSDFPLDGERGMGSVRLRLLQVLAGRTEGRTELLTGTFFLVFLVLLLAVQVQMTQFYISSLYMEDALASSNLASALADIQEYGVSHVIELASPQDSYELYKEALRTNLQLNEDWESTHRDLISGKVEIREYTVYNVRNRDVAVYRFGADGSSSYREPDGLGRVRTPDGRVVESTTVYSRIGFPVKGILGVEVYAQKDKSVDIVGEPEMSYSRLQSTE